MDKPVIQLRSLRKVFRDFWMRPTVVALKGLDLEVRRGEVFGLLGPNGSGKSTTIKMMLGLLRPTSGSIEILGASPESTAVKSRIGYLPELSHLHPFLTPRETLSYYASLFGIEKREAARRISQLLEMTGLTAAADRRVGGFSKGMARRVGLAQSLINAPELLILDEPTSGLDPIGTREVKDLIRSLPAAGVTVLTTSHLLADTEDICDRIAILNRGELCSEGDVGSLLRNSESKRFTVPGLSAEETEDVRGRLQRELGRPVEVDSPTVTLEKYFLQAVGKDRERQFRPAPFLCGESGADEQC